MLNLAKTALNSRFRRPLLITVVLLLVITLLGYQGTLNSALQKTITQIIPPTTPKGSPNDPNDSQLPDLSEWLNTEPAWMTAPKSDPNFNITESFLIRQEIGRNLTNIFQDYRPPIAAVNPAYVEGWPQMPAFQVNKQYNVDEVVAASGNFFLDEEDYTKFREQQQSLLKAIPDWAHVSKAYSGRGIVISAGAEHLARVWPNTVLMLRSLDCTLPIEVWTKDREEYQRTLPVVQQLRTELNITISVHTIADYIPVVFGVFDLPGIFKVKPLALMFSTFEETILLDVDSVPVMDPTALFDSKEAGSGLIQWPDFWSNSVSKVLHDVYDIDYQMTRTCESGQMLINKKLQFEPLVLATYFNWWGPDFFHKLIYLDSMGAGDKDTFYMGAAAFHREYHVSERNVELIRARKADGSLWKEALSLLNGALGQFNPSNTSEIFFMHFHAPKINMQAEELAGQFDIQFFHPDKDRNISFRMGEKWLETRLWENVKWIECESILQNNASNACEGVTQRVASMA